MTWPHLFGGHPLAGAGRVAAAAWRFAGLVSQNQIHNTTIADITNSTVTGAGAITVAAKDAKPTSLGNYLDTMAVPAAPRASWTGSSSELKDAPPESSASILSLP